ncbi:FAD-dependent oxidoreductase [Streptomyces sp. NPDC096132]|uniref:FAD-dependent oxidoreductase n=1 Tax=Streptomyces sp. NPDC096132 TaxID=3366075 RepID=UPI0037FA03F9
MNNVLVVGDGAVAQRLAERMRHHGHEGTLTTLVTDPETSRRRPSSQPGATAPYALDAFGTPCPAPTLIHPTAAVTALDRGQRRVLAHMNGATTAYSYDTLVLAPQARPLIPGIPGLVSAEGDLTEGVVALGTSFPEVRITSDTVVVLGEGALAVETASTLSAQGVDTTLVCASPHPLQARLGDICGAMLSEKLERAGITVLGGRTAVRREPGHLLLEDGTALRAGTLMLCTGAVPDTRLALDAGLNVHNGIVVDDRLRTSDPQVYAIGDCAEYDGHVMAGPRAAWEQAEALAEILTCRAGSYRPRPSALRLRTEAADVLTIGSLTDLRRPGTRLISLTDQFGRRYARLALHDERVVAAVLLGLPRAIATIGLLHRLGQRLPSDRLGLLLDLPPEPTSQGTEENNDPPVCLCNNVSKQTLFQAWRAGSRTVTELAGRTRATTGCGGCSRSVAELCGVWARETRSEVEKAA